MPRRRIKYFHKHKNSKLIEAGINASINKNPMIFRLATSSKIALGVIIALLIITACCLYGVAIYG